jgi:hypothetical protein
LLIKSAEQNLAINKAALADRFVVEEGLRGQQVGMEFIYGQTRLTDDYKYQSQRTLGDYRYQAERTQSDYAYQSAQIGMEQMEQSRQLLSQVNQLGNAANATLKKYEDDTTDLMASLSLDEARDLLGYQLQAITAMEQDGRLGAVAIAQQGGGATSQRLAMVAAQAAGRTYAELDNRAQSRDVKVAMANTTMRNATNSELTRLSLQAQDQIARGDYLMDKAKLDYELLTANYNRDTAYQAGAMTRDTAYQTGSFLRDSAYQADILENLTIPTFDLGQRQYGRELEALQLATDAKLYEASLPYRQAPFLDPLKPTPGLKPKMTAVGSVSGTSTFGMIGSALIQGLSSAESFNRAATGKSLLA